MNNNLIFRKLKEKISKLEKKNSKLEILLKQQKLSENKIFQQHSILKAINEIFRETLPCETDEEVAKKCLEIAARLTKSKFGFIAEVNKNGLLNNTAVSDSCWDKIKIKGYNSLTSLKDMRISGIRSKIIKEGTSLIINNPKTYSPNLKYPKGHSEIKSFLGVPLKHSDKITGMIALADNPKGYNEIDKETVEALSVTFIEVLNRKRKQLALKEKNKIILSQEHKYASLNKEFLNKNEEISAIYKELVTTNNALKEN